MSDGVEEYRAEPGSERKRRCQTNIFPVDGDRRSQPKSRRCSCQGSPLGGRLAVCEPVEVDDDGGIFGRQRINNTKRIFVR